MADGTFFRVEVRGDLGAAIRAEGRAVRKAVMQGMAQAGRDTRRDMLREFRSRLQSGRRLVGQRSLNGLVAVRRAPRTGFSSWTPRVWVQSRATYKRGGVRQEPIDLFAVFDEGATVRAANGKYLAIPTENAPFKKGRGQRKATPKEAAAASVPMRFVPIAPDKALLVDPRRPKGSRESALYILVRQVRLAKRISLDGIFSRNAGRVMDLIDEKLALELARITLRNV